MHTHIYSNVQTISEQLVIYHKNALALCSEQPSVVLERNLFSYCKSYDIKIAAGGFFLFIASIAAE